MDSDEVLDLQPSDEDAFGPTQPQVSPNETFSYPDADEEYRAVYEVPDTPASTASVAIVPPSSSLHISDSSTSSDSAHKSPTVSQRGRSRHRRATPVPLSQKPRRSSNVTPARNLHPSKIPPPPTQPKDTVMPDLTVVTLQQALRNRGIHFHRSDNKASLFLTLTTACSPPHSSRSPRAPCRSLPGHVTTPHASTKRRDVTTPPRPKPVGKKQKSENHSNQPKASTRSSTTSKKHFSDFSQVQDGGTGTGMLASHAAQQSATTSRKNVSGSPQIQDGGTGTGMSASPAAQQSSRHHSNRVGGAGTGMSVSPAAQQGSRPHSSRVGGAGTGLSVSPAAQQGSRHRSSRVGGAGTGTSASPAAQQSSRSHSNRVGGAGTGMPVSPAAQQSSRSHSNRVGGVGTGMPVSPAAQQSSRSHSNRAGGAGTGTSTRPPTHPRHRKTNDTRVVIATTSAPSGACRKRSRSPSGLDSGSDTSVPPAARRSRWQPPSSAGAPVPPDSAPTTANLQPIQPAAFGTSQMPTPFGTFYPHQQFSQMGVPGIGTSVPPTTHSNLQQLPMWGTGPHGAVPMQQPFQPAPVGGLQPTTLYNPGPSTSSGLGSQPSGANYSLATAFQPTYHPQPFMSRPSPVSTNLRNQILHGNYTDLALLISPSLLDSSSANSPDNNDKTNKPSPRSRDLSAIEFTYAFSLFRDIICSKFPGRRQELDDYLSIILNLALRFGGDGFYKYHIQFASEASARLQQFNQSTYWGTLDNKLYCRTFAARQEGQTHNA